MEAECVTYSYNGTDSKHTWTTLTAKLPIIEYLQHHLSNKEMLSHPIPNNTHFSQLAYWECLGPEELGIALNSSVWYDVVLKR
jgi:hypothetical protein